MFNLSFLEILLIVVVAVLAFGPRLPQVAAEAAHFMGRMRRSLADLRRETGIDREIDAARRAIEEARPDRWRPSEVGRTAQREMDEIQREVVSAPAQPIEPTEPIGPPEPNGPRQPGAREDAERGEAPAAPEAATPARPGTDRPTDPSAHDPETRP